MGQEVLQMISKKYLILERALRTGEKFKEI